MNARLKWVLPTLLCLTTLGAAAEDHQRIAATLPEVHSLSVAAGLSLTDVAGQVAENGGRVDVTYLFHEVLSAAVSVPLGSAAGGNGIAGMLRALGKASNLRTRVGLGWIVPGGVQASAGASWIQDPIVLGIDGTWHDVKGEAGWGLSFSATEVVNEAVSWSLSLLPSGQWVAGVPVWTFGLQVQVAWYSGDWNASSSTTSTSLTMTTEAGVGWHHGW